MTRYNILANSNDGFLRSSATVVDDAQEGSGGDFIMEVQTGLTVLHAGQKYEPSNGRTYVTQAFQEFTHTVVPTTDMVTSACYKLHGLEHVPSGDPWSLQVRTASDWNGGEVLAGDFVAKSGLPALDLLAEFPEIRTAQPKPAIWRAGTAELRTAVTEAAPLRVVLHSNKQLLGFHAGGTGDEFASVGSFEGATGPYRPRLEYSTATRSTLTRCAAGSVQLSDGTVAFLEFSGDDLFLRHRTNAGSETTIGQIPIGLDVYQFGLQNGAQAFSLVCDVTTDNLFVLGPTGAFANGIQAQAWLKGSGYSWSSKFALPHQLPTYDQPVNQVIGTYHHVGAGFIGVVAAHMQGYSFTNQAVLVSLSATSLVQANAALGPGNVAVANEDIDSAYLGAPINSCGAGLDICAFSGGRGIIAGATFDHGQSDSSENRGNVSVYTYQLSSSGQISAVPTRRFTTDTAGQVKGDGRIRAKLMPVSSNRFALLCAGTLSAYTFTSPSSVSRVGGFPWLQNSGLTAYPQNESGEAAAHPQDAIYDRASGKVFVYYPDTANSRRIMRTGFNVSTGLLDLAETQVETNTGPSGSSNVLVRTPRGTVDERFVQVHLGNRAADLTTLDTVHVGDDGLNLAPNAPTLNPVTVFSAGHAKAVSWTYSDSNIGDAQTAFQLQIRDQSSLVTALDTGKVTTATSSYTIAASALSNNETYEWRVRTYDTSDVIGPYSAYAVFSTTNTGVVDITNPAIDNPPGLASPTLLIEWTYTASGAQTQARYRVNVLRTDTGAQLSDSGYITGPDVRSYTVLGLISDVQQQIELRVEDSSGELTNTALRLVTPVFSGPDQPTFTAQASSDGSGIEVSVINPDPTGDLPAALRNDIYRRPAGGEDTDFVKIGESPPNTIFVDYGVASGTSYDYKVAAAADGDTDSEIVESVSTTFRGLYIHDPVDAVSTIRHFLYGKSNKSSQASTPVTAQRFVGRARPVYAFGEHLDEIVNVSIDVTDMDLDAWRADLAYLDAAAQSRAVRCYRDGRGRKVFGVITEARTADEDWGSTVTFTVSSAEFSEEFAG